VIPNTEDVALYSYGGYKDQVRTLKRAP